MIGVTGCEKEVAETAALYGVQYDEVELKGPAFVYLVNHTAVIYLNAPDGELYRPV
ncbi:MAG: SCO family protein [Rhodothermales bacterium]